MKSSVATDDLIMYTSEQWEDINRHRLAARFDRSNQKSAPNTSKDSQDEIIDLNDHYSFQSNCSPILYVQYLRTV